VEEICGSFLLGSTVSSLMVYSSQRNVAQA
jgi:hypothetical protein